MSDLELIMLPFMIAVSVVAFFSLIYTAIYCKKMLAILKKWDEKKSKE